MAIVQKLYTGDGSQTNFSFPFPYLKQADVKATLNGAATSAFTFATAQELSFTTAPANGVNIRIYRDTDTDTLQATFSPGSAIKAEDLNSNYTQNNYASQEAKADSLQAPTALSNSQNAVTTANAAAADAATALTAASNAVAYQPQLTSQPSPQAPLTATTSKY